MNGLTEQTSEACAATHFMHRLNLLLFNATANIDPVDIAVGGDHVGDGNGGSGGARISIYVTFEFCPFS